MNIKTSVSELDRADVFRLVDLMRDCDVMMIDLFDSICFSPYIGEFTMIKASTFLWGRISEQLGFSPGSCTDALPVIYPEDFDEDTNLERGVLDEIVEFYVNWYDLAEADRNLLEKSGIVISESSLGAVHIQQCKEEVVRAAIVVGEALGEDVLHDRLMAHLKESVCKDLLTDNARYVQELISYIDQYNLHVSDIICLRSERVGRFYVTRDCLRSVLPNDLVDAVLFLIKAVFIPLYVDYPDLHTEWVNDVGEYCCIFCAGWYGDYEDNALYDIHRRPYANIAVALLDRLLTEAETLVPDILGDAAVYAKTA